MAAFAYSGVQAGKKINGQINASDIKSASLQLRNKKIIVILMVTNSKIAIFRDFFIIL